MEAAVLEPPLSAYGTVNQTEPADAGGKPDFPCAGTGHKEREMMELFGIRPTALNCLKQNLFVCFRANRDRTLRETMNDP